MATDIKKIKFVYFVHMHLKAFHLTGYKQNLFFDLCQLYLKNYLRSLLSYNLACMRWDLKLIPYMLQKNTKMSKLWTMEWLEVWFEKQHREIWGNFLKIFIFCQQLLN